MSNRTTETENFHSPGSGPGGEQGHVQRHAVEPSSSKKKRGRLNQAGPSNSRQKKSKLANAAQMRASEKISPEENVSNGEVKNLAELKSDFEKANERRKEERENFVKQIILFFNILDGLQQKGSKCKDEAKAERNRRDYSIRSELESKAKVTDIIMSAKGLGEEKRGHEMNKFTFSIVLEYKLQLELNRKLATRICRFSSNLERLVGEKCNLGDLVETVHRVDSAQLLNMQTYQKNRHLQLTDLDHEILEITPEMNVTDEINKIGHYIAAKNEELKEAEENFRQAISYFSVYIRHLNQLLSQPIPGQNSCQPGPQDGSAETMIDATWFLSKGDSPRELGVELLNTNWSVELPDEQISLDDLLDFPHDFKLSPQTWDINNLTPIFSTCETAQYQEPTAGNIPKNFCAYSQAGEGMVTVQKHSVTGEAPVQDYLVHTPEAGHDENVEETQAIYVPPLNNEQPQLPQNNPVTAHETVYNDEEALLSEVYAQHPETAANCTNIYPSIRRALDSTLCRAVQILKFEPSAIKRRDLVEVDSIIETLERNGFQLSWLKERAKEKRKAFDQDVEEKERTIEKWRAQLAEMEKEMEMRK